MPCHVLQRPHTCYARTHMYTGETRRDEVTLHCTVRVAYYSTLQCVCDCRGHIGIRSGQTRPDETYSTLQCVCDCRGHIGIRSGQTRPDETYSTLQCFTDFFL
jgi:hypothetical protein